MKSLPDRLVGADWRDYIGTPRTGLTPWQQFTWMWWAIAYVRLQAFEREEDAHAGFDVAGAPT